ncbi:hypothetical protein MDV012.4 [Gallid alphaherpesvirus 2]|uniref:Uncharacterized protein n=1 Tax=Gallid alphaherpesvirus 2 TaxID=10390 RepID=Q19BF8_9ALPH|nr:hypothetical protein MDV012.4 [Gallid alphaherpesvirus 2]ACF49666.1 hypothetical protein MDV012.4 [synthetic construct]ABR13072.1 hypothetical protein MDV012.4 [Gallid alphaherpesvirus 2]ACF94955.1 hypothetical protein MDV012.4 [Gallid alphaherpesvirus 2]ACR02850.1 hypothetical protein MDV012.4 [synthetic construct]
MCYWVISNDNGIQVQSGSPWTCILPRRTRAWSRVQAKFRFIRICWVLDCNWSGPVYFCIQRSSFGYLLLSDKRSYTCYGNVTMRRCRWLRLRFG